MPPEFAVAPDHITRCLRVAAREIDLAGPTLSQRNTSIGRDRESDQYP